MGALIPEETIDRIRHTLDIVDVIGSYMPLKKSGADYKGVCPFHDDSRPSLTVSQKKQIYKCFACGAGGNVYSFVMDYDKVTFPEAVEMLAERAGIKIERDPKQAEQAQQRSDLYRVMEWACKVYERALRAEEGEAGLNYMRGRGFTDESMQTFRVGFAPGSWDYLVKRARAKGIAVADLEACDLVRRDGDGNLRDRFVNRVMFPILDVRERPIAFGGRILDQGEPKYLNSSETPLFHKRAGLYGISQARDASDKKGLVALMEGYTDVMMAHQQGARYCVATLGTALTEEQVRMMMRYAKTAVLFFDADAAGMKAVERSLPIFFSQGMNVRVASIPEGKDPFDYTRAQGGAAFDALVDGAPDAIDYLLLRARADKRMDSVAGKRTVFNDLAKLLNEMNEEAQLNLYISRAAQAVGLSETVLREELKSMRRARRAPEAAKTPQRRKEVIDGLTTAERGLCSVALHRPELLHVVEAERTVDEFQDWRSRSLLDTMLRLKAKGLGFSQADLISEFKDPEWTDFIDKAWEMSAETEDFNVYLDQCIDRIRDYETSRIEGADVKSRVTMGEITDPEERKAALRKFYEIHQNRPAHRPAGGQTKL